VVKLQIIEEPRLAFHQNKMHVDIRAGLSAFGASDKGGTGVPIDRPAVLGGVDVGGPQIGDQKLLATEHIKRQEAVVVVKPVEEPPFLTAMHRHIDGVEVEDQFRRRRSKRTDELLDQDAVQSHSGGAIGPVLESAQGRRTRQRRDALDRRLQRQILTQVAMVVEILVAERQAVQTLPQLRQRAVPATPRIPWIAQLPRRRRAQPEPAIGGPHQQHSPVAGHRAARKIHRNRPLAAGWKIKTPLGTVRHRQDPPLDFAYATESQHHSGLGGILLNPADEISGLGVIGTTATVDGVRDWLEQCKNGVASGEKKLTTLRPPFPGMTEQVFGTSLELSDTATRTITRHELTAAPGKPEPLRHLAETFMQHARDLAGKSGLHVLVVAPPPEVFALGDAPQASVSDPPIDELQEPAPEQLAPSPSTLKFHDLFKAQAIDLQLPCQVLRPDTYGSSAVGRTRGRRLQDKATTAWNCRATAALAAWFLHDQDPFRTFASARIEPPE
jgi:hypothetical protein